MTGNILLTSAGRRVALWRDLQADARSRNQQVKVFCADMQPEQAAACIQSGSGIALPHVQSPAYAEALLKACRQYNITTVIPLLDTELSIFAALRPAFAAEGINLVVSSPELTAVCSSKRALLELFRQLGLNTPRELDPTSPRFPCFVKPLSGSSSAGTYAAMSLEELKPADLNPERSLLLEYLAPELYREYSLDLYYDETSQLREACARERLKTRAGEVEKAITRKPAQWEQLLEAVQYLPGAYGPLTLQIFEHRNTGDLLASEINARLGGGVPLSVKAGSILLQLIAAVHCGESFSIQGFTWKEGIEMIRFDDAFFL